MCLFVYKLCYSLSRACWRCDAYLSWDNGEGQQLRMTGWDHGWEQGWALAAGLASGAGAIQSDMLKRTVAERDIVKSQAPTKGLWEFH